MYLEQNAAQKADELEGLFELAVMLFVKGEYRKALEQLAKVQVSAQPAGSNLRMSWAYAGRWRMQGTCWGMFQ